MKQKFLDNLTQEYVRSILNYNPETGIVQRKVYRGPNAKKGDIIKTIDSWGYIIICIDKSRYRLHRIIWLYMTGKWPKDQIDHINRIKADNKWCNLREATPSQNKINAIPRSNNTSGHQGITWRKNTRKWRARICVNYKRIHLGYFNNKKEAIIAYETAAKQYFGDFYQQQEELGAAVGG